MCRNFSVQVADLNRDVVKQESVKYHGRTRHTFSSAFIFWRLSAKDFDIVSLADFRPLERPFDDFMKFCCTLKRGSG